MPQLVSDLSFWFALLLSVGSLVFYFSGAWWNRPHRKERHDKKVDFNLGLPKTKKPEGLFAMSLVSAGTSLATVFVFFLTASALFGWWLMLCPILFALGNGTMLKVFERVRDLGYFEEKDMAASTGAAGLVPYLAERLTGSRAIARTVMALSIINILAVLVLELVVGVEVLGYLTQNAFGVGKSTIVEFLLFAICVSLLIGYVFVGGFRAVVSSDVWQMKAMKWAVFFTILCLTVFLVYKPSHSIDLSVLSKSPPLILLWGFILNVVLANLFSPLSQESSWQRFRAFYSLKTVNFRKAILLSVATAFALWSGLIIASFLLQLSVPKDSGAALSSISGVLGALRTLDTSWFPLFVFPVLTVAAVSAMFSTSDTGIAALTYLIDYSTFSSPSNKKAGNNSLVDKHSNIIIACVIFLLSVGVYSFARIWFKPTILQLVFSVFSNLVVIAPTVLTVAIFSPIGNEHRSKNRIVAIGLSMALGFVGYWSTSIYAMVKGESHLWLSQLSIAFGLIAAIIPCLPLWLGIIKTEEKEVQK